MYPYRSTSYGSGASSRAYTQSRVTSSVASQPFDDDLPMYVMREDALPPRYAVPSDRLQAAYYAGGGGGHYEAGSSRGLSQRYYDEGPKRQRTSYPEAYSESRYTATASAYPQRPGEQKCSFYMRTARCSYGADCKFDHPAWVPPEGIPGWKEEEGEYPQRPGQPHCAYFIKNGTCKFGSTCKFDHPGGATASSTRSSAPVPVERGVRSDAYGSLNSKGLPLRPTEPLCQYYRKNGDCKYGMTCKFDHPDPGSSKRKRTDMNDDLQDVPLYSVLPGTSFPSNSAPPSRPALLPQRPGQPECAFYMRTGSCQYGATCKYHHPTSRKGGEAPKATKVVKPNREPPPAGLTPAGLPRRPGATLCSYYMKTGLCKYAPDCKYDHPPPGEAAKMAYRAASAGKAAAVVDSAGGSAKPVEQTPTVEEEEEKVAEGEGNGEKEGAGKAEEMASGKAEEMAPQGEVEHEGDAEQKEEFDAVAVETEGVGTEAGVETEVEEGGNVSHDDLDQKQEDQPDGLGDEETRTENVIEAPVEQAHGEQLVAAHEDEAAHQEEGVGREDAAAKENEVEFMDAEDVGEEEVDAGGEGVVDAEGNDSLHEAGLDLNVDAAGEDDQVA